MRGYEGSRHEQHKNGPEKQVITGEITFRITFPLFEGARFQKTVYQVLDGSGMESRR
jgi:hypothetical protein